MNVKVGDRYFLIHFYWYFSWYLSWYPLILFNVLFYCRLLFHLH